MLKKSITESIIGVLAVVSIVLVAIETLVALSPGALWGLYAADLLICIVFAFDFIRRVRGSERKSHYFWTHSYEILAMIPAVALYGLGMIPALSVAFRSIRLVRVIRAILLLTRMRRLFSTSGGFFQRSNLLTMFAITFAIIFIAAFIVLACETGTEKAQITTFSDAVWWSITTVTTVGYGDIVPHTAVGRMVGMVLMVVGIGVMAAFISQVSATLVESRMKKSTEKDDIKTAVISEIKTRLDNLDKMSEGEVASLVQMIRALRTKE
jgi:voltage-gated potassium channel